jgi:F-type H+-transporting ATPase subunit epsilon
MLTVQIITPAKSLPRMQAEHVTLPAFDGEVGIRPGHAAFICQLGKGLLHVKLGAEDQCFRLRGGVARVEHDSVQILAERIEAI